jgi:DNA polymerase-3 subunit alpha
MLNNEAFLFFKGRVQNRYNQDDNFEVKITSIQLLDEIANSLSKHITINLNLSEIDELLIDKLTAIVNNYPGKIPLRLNIKDGEEKSIVGTQSKKFKVSANGQLFRELQVQDLGDYKIN